MVRLPSCVLCVLLLSGCDLILGIEDWTDPPTVGGSGGSGGDPTSSSSTGGASSSSTGTGGTLTLTGTCADGLLDPGETDVDCGGDACAPCQPGEACLNDADCSTLACVSSTCATNVPEVSCLEVDPDNPNCSDCETNGGETDTDCGGDACAPCAEGAICSTNADCTTGTLCTANVCTTGELIPSCGAVDPLVPSCLDCEQNGEETGVDCGGDACPPCP